MNKDDTIDLLRHATEVKNDHIRKILVSLLNDTESTTDKDNERNYGAAKMVEVLMNRERRNNDGTLCEHESLFQLAWNVLDEEGYGLTAAELTFDHCVALVSEYGRLAEELYVEQ